MVLGEQRSLSNRFLKCFEVVEWMNSPVKEIDSLGVVGVGRSGFSAI